MITANAFFSGSLNTVDAVIGHFVNTAYTHFVAANASMITLLFTLYVMLLGYQFLMHTSQFNMTTITRHLIVMLVVYGMVMNWQLYHLFVYQVFTTEPGNIAKILVNSVEKSQAVQSIAEALDGIYDAVINATVGFFGQVSFSTAGIAFIFYGMLVFIIGILMCIYALLLFVYAKMMMAVTLALGPIFILFILWEPTKSLFSAWLNKLITLALIPIVTSAILMFMLSVIHVTLPSVNQPADQLQFYGIAPFLGLSLTTTLILSQVFRICSSLAGGITLSGLSAGAVMLAAAFKKPRVMPAVRDTKNWLQHKVGQMKQRLGRGTHGK